MVLKAHALLAGGGSELRVVLIRKGGDAVQRVTVRVDGLYARGELALLLAPSYTSYHDEASAAVCHQSKLQL